MRVLVDMDGVLADFEGGLLSNFQKLYPDMPYIPSAREKAFMSKSNTPKEVQPLLEDIYTSRGFYLNLPQIEGSLETLKEISKKHEVYICTSPLLKNPFCIPEKYDWVAGNLGKDWVERVIVTKDKTLILGDLLIDDKPNVNGVQAPSWEHILYSQPYNKPLPLSAGLRGITGGAFWVTACDLS